MAQVSNPPGSLQVRRYLTNVFWSWAGLAVTLVVGFFLSPYIIRRIGDTSFGLWSLTLSFIEYYWLIDLGLRSATLKYSAQYRAEGNAPKLNELLSTGLVYSAASGFVLFAITLAFAPQIGRLLHIDQPVFATMVRIIGLSWALGLVFNRYSAFLEGFQRFDITSRIWIISTAVRTAGLIVLLHLGYGLIAMALMLLGSQLLAYLLSYVDLRRLFPAHDVGWRKATRSMLKQMAGYGVHSLTIVLGNRLLTQSTPFLIAYFLPVRYVAYYAVPVRLLEYAMESVGRIGMVTAPSAAEMQAKGRPENLVTLGVYANRYCLTIFLPVAVVLWTYGYEFMSLWIRPDFARESVPLLRVVLIGSVALAGQFNSVSILCGLGTHKVYARSLMVEAALGITGMSLAIPRFGLVGAAAVSAALTVANRGIFCGILAARQLKVHTLRYLSQIYTIPLLVAAVSIGALYWAKLTFLPGRSWVQFAAGAALAILIYGALSFRFSLEQSHRGWILTKIGRVLSPKVVPSA